jgi:hypothetical protein
MRKYLAAIIVALVASSAAAVPLDLDNPNGIAALYTTGTSNQFSMVYVVCTDGSAYFGAGGSSTWQTFIPAPVPLSQVVDWTPWMLYTTDGRWFMEGAPSPNSSWELMDGTHGTYMPPPCFGPVKTDQAPMGKVKALFR